MLLTADRVVTMDHRRRVLSPGWIRIEGTRIVDLGEGAPPVSVPVDHHAGLATPGLVSAHQHVVDALLRGLDPGEQFLDWLLGVYYLGLSHATPEDCRLATEVVMAQVLCSGITTVVDCWGLDGGDPDTDRLDRAAAASLDAHQRSGARVLFATMFAEHLPGGWPDTWPGLDLARLCAPADRTFARVRRLSDVVVGATGGRVRVTPMPELPELVSDASFRGAAALARELGAVLPVHLCASPASRAACGPAELEDLGVLGPELLGVHCIAVDDEDVRALAAAGVGIAHCPTANQRFPGGTTPVHTFRAAGASVGLGLDNATLNPRIDLLAEARAATLAVAAGGATLAAADAFAMATCDAATAIGLGDEVGVLAAGRRADVVLHDTTGAHWSPDGDPYEALVWRAMPADVRTVVVDGAVVVDEGRCRTLQPDLDAFRRAAERLQHAVSDTRVRLGPAERASVSS